MPLWDLVDKLYYSGLSGETEQIGYPESYNKRFITEIGSRSYGGWKVPWYAICKTENQERQWYNSVQPQRPENWGLGAGEGCGWGKSWWKSEDPRTGNADAQGQGNRGVLAQAKRANSPFLYFLVLFRPLMDCMMSTLLVRVIFFDQSTDWNANHFWKHPHRHTQK